MISKNVVCEAITNKQVVEFYYKGHKRIVEPHLVGTRTTGNIELSAFQTGGYSESKSIPFWRGYLLAEITQWNPTDETFERPRNGYNRNDSRMTHIYCRL